MNLNIRYSYLAYYIVCEALNPSQPTTLKTDNLGNKPLAGVFETPVKLSRGRTLAEIVDCHEKKFSNSPDLKSDSDHG